MHYFLISGFTVKVTHRVPLGDNWKRCDKAKQKSSDSCTWHRAIPALCVSVVVIGIHKASRILIMQSDLYASNRHLIRKCSNKSLKTK